MKGNIPGILKATNDAIAAKGAAGRFSTWPIPTNYLHVEACVEIARDTVEGKMDLNDMNAVKERLETAAGVSMGIRKLPEHEKENFYLITSASVIFGKDEF